MFTHVFEQMASRSGRATYRWIVGAVFVLAAMAAGCASSEGPSDNDDTRVTPPQQDSIELQYQGEIAYDYVATTDGIEAVNGTMTLDFGDGSQDLRAPEAIAGHWELRVVQSLPNLGVEPGSGPLEARFDAENHLIVAMHPNWADHNVTLDGTFDDDGVLSGAWSYTNFTGLVRTGEFIARPK